MDQSIDNLKDFLNANNIEFTDTEFAINNNSIDTSLFKVKPKIIVFPKNVNDISAISKYVYDNHNLLSITSRSAGTDMSGGPLNDSIILSFTKYFNNIIHLDKDNKTVYVEPGVYYRDLEKYTIGYNLYLPSYPASRELCTIGGIVSNNSGGEKSLIYGKTENYVEELECVLSNGEIVNFKPVSIKELEQIINSDNVVFKNRLEYKIYKDIYGIITDEKKQNIILNNKPNVSKNSAGYYLWNLLSDFKNKGLIDITKIITGSQGTLANIAKIKLRLIEPKKYTKMLVVFMRDIAELGKLREVIMKYNPESFESYDDHTLKVALKFFPLILKRIIDNNKNKDKKINFFKLIFSFLPELWMIISGGVPKLILIAEFAGDDEKEVIEILVKADKDIKASIDNHKIKTEIITDDNMAEKYWVIRRESFNLLRQKMKSLRTAPFIEDVVVSGDKFKPFLEELVPILDKYNLLYTVAGHVGDGNIHVIPLMNLKGKIDRQANIQKIKDCSLEVYNLVKKYKGSITGEHNDGLIRTPFLDKMYDADMLALFRDVKNIFDPYNILNPGKKVDIKNRSIDDILKLVD